MPRARGLAALAVLVCAAGAGVRGVVLRVHGDVLFAMQLSEAAQRRLARPATPAPPAHCAHSLPQQDQVDAILSNMMNELTKVFVRANFFLKNEDNIRDPGVWRAEDDTEGNAEPPPPPASRGSASTEPSPSSSPASSPSPSPSAPTTSPSAATTSPSTATTSPTHRNRFKVVKSKKTQFFEHIFRNMTEEFSNKYNASMARHVARARRDPCPAQGAVAAAWRGLLRHSLAAFRRAALHCVHDYLKMQECSGRTKGRLVRFLVRELAKTRARHLQLLCDTYQLCLHDDQPPEPPPHPSQ